MNDDKPTPAANESSTSVPSAAEDHYLSCPLARLGNAKLSTTLKKSLKIFATVLVNSLWAFAGLYCQVFVQALHQTIYHQVNWAEWLYLGVFMPACTRIIIHAITAALLLGLWFLVEIE